jgi:hypothetical protein
LNISWRSGTESSPMGLADLHLHTTDSWDGTSAGAGVLRYVAAQPTYLDVIAITDHDAIAGSLQAVELAPAYGVQVIPGSGVPTADGHMLAPFIEKLVPPNLSLAETALSVAEQGGGCASPLIPWPAAPTASLGKPSSGPPVQSCAQPVSLAPSTADKNPLGTRPGGCGDCPFHRPCCLSHVEGSSRR